MNTQTAYEKMRVWVTRPGASRAYSELHDQCLYRTPDGNKCIVGGILSPDALGEVQGAEGGISDIIFEGSECVITMSELRNVDINFLRDAQNLHDQACNWDDEDGFDVDLLDRLAEKYGLQRADQVLGQIDLLDPRWETVKIEERVLVGAQ